MDITAVLILITTGKEMKKKNTGIAVKELQLEHNFCSRICQLFIVFQREKCIHEDCTERVVVNKDDTAVLLFIMR